MFVVQTSMRNYLIKATSLQVQKVVYCINIKERDSWIESIRNLVEISRRVSKNQGAVKGAAKYERELVLHARDLLFYSSRLAQTYLLCFNFSPDSMQQRIALKEVQFDSMLY